MPLKTKVIYNFFFVVFQAFIKCCNSDNVDPEFVICGKQIFDGVRFNSFKYNLTCFFAEDNISGPYYLYRTECLQAKSYVFKQFTNLDELMNAVKQRSMHKKGRQG